MSYITAISNLQTVLLTIAGAVGGVFLAFGLFKFAVAFQKMDQNGEHNAIYTIVAGGILLGGSALIAVLS